MPKRADWKTLKVGLIIDREFAGKNYKLKVIKVPDGVAYELEGRVFMTPTAAAKSITKFEINGWKFWHLKKE